jgi:hypothetical protein
MELHALRERDEGGQACVAEQQLHLMVWWQR